MPSHARFWAGIVKIDAMDEASREIAPTIKNTIALVLRYGKELSGNAVVI
jgi:hypothetical protein